MNFHGEHVLFCSISNHGCIFLYINLEWSCPSLPPFPAFILLHSYSFPQGMQQKIKIAFPVFLVFVFQKQNPLEKGIYVHEQNVLLDGMRKVESPSDEDKIHLTEIMRERVWEASEGEREFLSF